MKNALDDSLSQAIDVASKSKLTLSIDAINFKENQVCEIKYDYTKPAEEENKDDDHWMEIDSVAQEEKWYKIVFKADFVIKMPYLFDGGLKMSLELAKDKQCERVAKIREMADPDVLLVRKAELKVLNKQMFDLIQDMQRAGSDTDKNAVMKKNRDIDKSLNEKHLDFMKIANKTERKELLTKLQECKETSNAVRAELRSAMDSGCWNFSNAIIANLNNKAFKGLKNERFQKMRDNFALNNLDGDLKREQEVQEIIGKYDFDQIRKENEEVINEVGADPLSCNDAAEALQDGDCMCISLQVTRPEQAIADPSRVRIRDIIPTYLTAGSFLEAAQFSITEMDGNEAGAHGGFDKEE